jgi:hypothetical protein
MPDRIAKSIDLTLTISNSLAAQFCGRRSQAWRFATSGLKCAPDVAIMPTLTVAAYSPVSKVRIFCCVCTCMPTHTAGVSLQVESKIFQVPNSHKKLN